MNPYGTMIFQVAAGVLLIVLRFPRKLFANQVTVKVLEEDAGVRRRITFEAFSTGSYFALAAIGILNGRVLAGEAFESTVRLGGFSVLFFCAIVAFVILQVMEMFALGQLEQVADEDILALFRSHFMLGIALPLPVGLAMIFWSVVIT